MDHRPNHCSPGIKSQDHGSRSKVCVKRVTTAASCVYWLHGGRSSRFPSWRYQLPVSAAAAQYSRVGVVKRNRFDSDARSTAVFSNSFCPIYLLCQDSRNVLNLSNRYTAVASCVSFDEIDFFFLSYAPESKLPESIYVSDTRTFASGWSCPVSKTVSWRAWCRLIDHSEFTQFSMRVNATGTLGGGSQVERRRRENRGALGGEWGKVWGGAVPLHRKFLNFSSQNGVIWCILCVLVS